MTRSGHTGSNGGDRLRIPVAPGRWIELLGPWPLTGKEWERLVETLEFLRPVLGPTYDVVTVTFPEDEPPWKDADEIEDVHPAAREEGEERTIPPPPPPTLDDLFLDPEPPLEDLFPPPPEVPKWNGKSHGAKHRLKVPCPECDRLMPTQGLENHRRAAHPERREEDVPLQEWTEPPVVTWSYETDEPDLSPVPYGPEIPFECVHHWILESPVGLTVLGKCRYCSKEQTFPADTHTVFSDKGQARKHGACPECGSPVTKDGRYFWCGHCNRTVLVPVLTPV